MSGATSSQSLGWCDCIGEGDANARARKKALGKSSVWFELVVPLGGKKRRSLQVPAHAWYFRQGGRNMSIEGTTRRKAC